MSSKRSVLPFIVFLSCASVARTEPPESTKSGTVQTVYLNVDAGVPLRVYLTQRLTKRLGDTVHARLLEPVFAFDREVIPANTEVLGEVVRIDRVSKMRRATAIAA